MKRTLGGKGSLDLGLEPRQNAEISQTGMQQIPDRWNGETERPLAKRFQITFRKLQKLLV